MESSNAETIIAKNTSRGRPAQKRKWREIEEIKDRQRLKQELKELGILDDLELDSMIS